MKPSLKSKHTKKRKVKPSAHLIEVDYLAKTALWKKLREEASFIVSNKLETSDVRIHTISSRIKTFKAFAEKADRKQLSSPYDQVQDIVGIRIVCLFISDIERIGKQIEDSFDVVSQDNKIDGSEVSSFGYMSVHFVVKMKSIYCGPRYDDIADQVFEIQVRTIAMDAWAAASHYLDYKSEGDVPSDLRRDFFALSGLFYVADRHFEMFFNARKTAIAEITSTLKLPSATWDQELNLDSLKAYLKLSLPDRKQPDGPTLADLANELRRAGQTTIKGVKEMVDKNFNWFLEREKSRPPSNLAGKTVPNAKFQSVGVVRIILHERYLKEAELDPSRPQK